MHSWTLAYAHSSLDVLHAAQKSPQALEAHSLSPPVRTFSMPCAGSPPPSQHPPASSLLALEMPRSNLGTNHAQTPGWERRAEQRKALIVSCGPSLVSALGACLAAGPALGPWRAASPGVAGTCPCWETWRPRRARTLSSVRTSRLLEFTSGFPPSGCQGARSMPTARPRMRRGAFPGRTPGTPRAFSWTGTDGAPSRCSCPPAHQQNVPVLGQSRERKTKPGGDLSQLSLK